MKMSDCKNCVICGKFIGLGNDPAVCNACWPEYEAETNFNRMCAKVDDLKKNQPQDSEKICGNCIWFKMRTNKDDGPWVKPLVCKSEKANPGHKDRRDGRDLYYIKACEFWEW